MSLKATGMMGSLILTVLQSIMVIYLKGIVQFYDVSDALTPAILFLYFSFLAISFLSAVAYGLLLLGIKKERHWLLVPWFINTVIHMGYSIVIVYALFYASLSSQRPEHIVAILFFELLLAGDMHFVCTLFEDMKREVDQQRPKIQLQDALVPQSTIGLN